VVNLEDKQKIKDELFDIYDFFNRERLILMPDGKTQAHIKPDFDARMTPQAWARYNKLESSLTNAALETGVPHLTPVYDRLAKSIMKAAMLIAASQVRDGGNITVTEEDVIHAIYYGRHWHAYASEIVSGVGKSPDERTMDAIIDMVVKSDKIGVDRSAIMRQFKLDAKRADLLLTTIVQRRLVMVIQLAGQPRYVGT